MEINTDIQHTVVTGVRDRTGVKPNKRGATGVLPGVFMGMAIVGTS
jgi:hypothetical protein